MTGVLIAFMVVLMVPLFVATWRTSLLGLSLQGLLMSWIVFHGGAHTALSADAAVKFVDLVVLRTLAGPLLLYLVLRRRTRRDATTSSRRTCSPGGSPSRWC